MNDRKKWGLASIITGAVLLVVGIVVFFTTATPAWLLTAISIVDVVLTAVGLPLMLVPKPPA